MEDLLYYSLTIAACIAATTLLSILRSFTTATRTPPPPPPPGPSPLLSLITPLLFLGRTNFGIERVLSLARSRYGPVFTLHLLPSRPAIFITSRAAAHRALVQCGAAFADRPPATLPFRVFSSGQRNITSAAYGPLWRALRHNLTGKVFHPSRVGQYAAARRRALRGLVAAVAAADGGEGVVVVVVEPLLHRAMFRVLVAMCFGERLAVVAAVEALQREFLTSVLGFQVFGVCPALTKLLFRRRWRKMLSLRRRQEELFGRLIRARRAQVQRRDDDDAADGDDGSAPTGDTTTAYVDTLLDLRIPDEGGGGRRSLTEGEVVSLCAEFVAVGTDNTATEAQWIMANLVAQPEIQARLRAEIHQITAGGGGSAGGVEEQDLPRMPYLRAVVLEGLRRHPPGHFAIPHAATGIEDDDGGVWLEGYRVPRRASLNFPLVAYGLDAAVWRDPLVFRPERFLPGGEGAGVDLTGGKGVTMIPFGAGRRICPGMALALLHLELFVAGLVAEFEWAQVPREPVEFAERQELSVVMRRPLRAIVVRCTRNNAPK